MKRVYHILLIAFTCSMFSICSAQALEEIHVGGGFAIGTEADGVGGVGFGLDIRGLFTFSEKIRGAANIHYFFPEDPLGWWTLDGNVHYVLIDDGTDFYVLAGLNYATVEFGFGGIGTLSATEVGLNVGSGVIIPTDFGGLFGEAKYVISDLDQLVISAGVLFEI